ncbi:armadillo-type protein [Pavlovales sp. CCMP2436]|nr:armadillo-type protein [Pavlovales sp. CCMP2436]
MDITQLLVNAQSPDANTRQHAEQTMEQAKQSNLPMFLITLSAELANEEKPPEARRLAGIIVKNSLDGKSAATQHELTEAWVTIDMAMKQQIKMSVTSALGSAAFQARQAAAQVVAKIAAIELPRGEWGELIDLLTSNVATQNDFLKQATLECLGYICEEIEPQILAAKSNQVLTAVVQGMRKEETNNDVRRAATVALNNALEFVKTNFDNEQERNYIMQTVCEACVSEAIAVRSAAYECVVKIAGLYYGKLAPYMQALFQLTFEEIKNGTDQVAQQAVEFWSTICDEEIEIHLEMEEARGTGESPDQVSQDFVKGAMPYLVPLLLQTLTKQDEDQEDDAWNVAMAAGTALALVAQACGDGVVPHVMEFVKANIQSADWRFREASTLSFGSLLEGPSKEVLAPLVLEAVPIMVTLMRDPSVQVRDTAGWTIGRICDHHSEIMQTQLIKPGGVLLEALKDEPRVAHNTCWAIHNLAEALDDETQASSPLSPYFLDIVRALVVATERSDSAENNLRASSYEALNTVLSQSSMDTMPSLREIVPFLCEKLEKTFAMQIVSADDREEQNELQGLLCGTLQVREISHELSMKTSGPVNGFPDSQWCSNNTLLA